MYQRRDFYRHARYVHGWLSAFAFLSLMFFAATGLFLNHPQWFSGKTDEHTSILPLPVDLGQKIRQQENPSDIILQYLRGQYVLTGHYQSSEMVDGDVMMRLESPAGSTDIWVNLDDQQIEITKKTASTVAMLNDLHRGKNSGTLWSWLIDISAILILVLSLAGFVLFLSMKTRLKNHLVLLGLGTIILILLIWLAV
ncbi:PepSY-associated TM helix domain-containing protein [Alkanindiges sp. WGS2144]|uniref:PepSY-associated TM helix domain-containing protein n=1 Tax=Alkanindiges sp. WGS2144 TaxID=3366808 RepID=UPI003753E763